MQPRVGRLRGWPARGAPANVDPNETAARIIAAVNTVDGDAAVGAPLPGDRDEPVRLAGARDHGRDRVVARVVEAMELVVDDDADDDDAVSQNRSCQAPPPRRAAPSRCVWAYEG